MNNLAAAEMYINESSLPTKINQTINYPTPQTHITFCEFHIFYFSNLVCWDNTKSGKCIINITWVQVTIFFGKQPYFQYLLSLLYSDNAVFIYKEVLVKLYKKFKL